MPAEEQSSPGAELLALMERLVADYADVLPAGTVIRCVADCYGEAVDVGLRDGLIVAVEAAARTRLRVALPMTAA